MTTNSKAPWAWVVSAVFLGLACLGGQSASAQGYPLGRFACEGEYAGIPVAGYVDMSLLTYGGAGSLGGSVERTQLQVLWREGRLHELPGLINLMAMMQNGYGQLVNFDVTLTGGTTGTGAFWVNGASHRQTFMNLALQPGGFIIQSEDGVRAPFRCDVGGATTTGPAPGQPRPKRRPVHPR